MKPVLFASHRPISRAENINAVFYAYRGEKLFIQLDMWRRHPQIGSGYYDLLVTDEIPAESPGKCIFIGHGIPGGKLYGLDQKYPYATRRDAALIDYAITSSPDTIPIVSNQLALDPKRVLPLGMPRTDLLRHTIGNMKFCLYAPTFRGHKEQTGARVNFGLIDELLNDDEVLIVKPHMLDGQMLSRQYKHIREFGNDIPSETFINMCDVLITDYSSIMFDAMVIRTPVILFEKDWSNYGRERGMYFPYPEGYSNRHCTSEEELVDLIRNARWSVEDEERRAVFAQCCDGHSRERVVNLIEELNK